jgi:hypothetical protein
MIRRIFDDASRRLTPCLESVKDSAAASIDALPKGDLTFLTLIIGEHTQGLVKDSLGNFFGEAFHKVGFPAQLTDYFL